MRILFLSTWFPYPPDNGSKLRAFYLLRELQRRHTVTAIAFQPEYHHSVPSISIPTNNHERSNIIAVHDDPFRFVDAPQLVKSLSLVPLACWPSQAMRTAVQTVVSENQDYDVVVALQEPAATYAMQIHGVPRLLDVDVSLGYQRFAAYQKAVTGADRVRQWVGWRKTMRYEKRLFSAFEVCTLVFDQEAGYFQEQFRGSSTQYVVNENGVDTKHNQPGLAVTKPHHLIYNGALTYRANYDAMQYFLAEIYPLIKTVIPKVSLTITGSTMGVEFDGLALDESVCLTGYVDDVRIPVAEAAVCITPIRQGGGTRLKILEAMALGTPVVATSKGAEGLNVVDGVHILLADDPASFAHLTVKLLTDADLRRRLATNARHLVEEGYEWEIIGREFVGLAEAMGSRNGR